MSLIILVLFMYDTINIIKKYHQYYFYTILIIDGAGI